MTREPVQPTVPLLKREAWIPSYCTNVRKTFEAFRAQQAQEKKQ